MEVALDHLYIKSDISAEPNARSAESAGCWAKAPGVAIVALGGTRRPGRDGSPWPPLRSLGHRHRPARSRVGCVPSDRAAGGQRRRLRARSVTEVSLPGPTGDAGRRPRVRAEAPSLRRDLSSGRSAHARWTAAGPVGPTLSSRSWPPAIPSLHCPLRSSWRRARFQIRRRRLGRRGALRGEAGWRSSAWSAAIWTPGTGSRGPGAEVAAICSTESRGPRR
jgi:hypothetical protein